MEEFTRFMLNETPYFIAQKYRRIIDAKLEEQKVYYALQLYELALRTLAIGLVLQYLVKDSNAFSSQEVNDLIEEKLPIATLDIWEEILFSILRAYAGRRESFFMTELYDFYIDENTTPPREQSNKRKPFTRLTQIEADINKASTDLRMTVDWNTTWKEINHLLEQIFNDFRFITKYRVIHPVKKVPGGYQFVSYIGENPTLMKETIVTNKELNTNYLYLCNFHGDKQQEILNLYPLFLILDLLPGKLDQSTKPQDLAIYERYNHDQIYYLIAHLWKVVPHSIPVGKFVDLIFHVIQRVKQHQIQEVEFLSWSQLSEVAYTITKRRMANVLGKYQHDLYLQRADILSAFEEFLNSDKTGFILVGKSGVGKSNFLGSLLDEYRSTHPNVCFLMYNGAKLNPSENINVTIVRDFDNHLKLMRSTDVASKETIWHAVNRIPDIFECRVVLCIDAINENPNPKELIDKIDDLIQESPWTWLKVLTTCRTEAWKVIRRTVTLAEDCYYRNPTGIDDTEQLAIEMGGFKYSEEIPTFDRHNELPIVYENYAKRFEIQTRFEDLEPVLKEALQDPLLLRLVMTQFRKSSIPKTINPDHIYRDYINYLMDQGYLDQSDLDFLLFEVMPLMLNEKVLLNKVPASIVADHITTDKRRLFDLIHNKTRLSNGDRVNKSFERLVFNEILASPESDRLISYDIAFKYERFYDYFAATRLEQFLDEHNNEFEQYKRLLNNLTSAPFLWSATITTLVRQIELNIDLVLALAYSTNLTECKTVSIALVEGARVLRQTAYIRIPDLLEEILNNHYHRRLLKHPTEQEVINAKRVAVEVSAHLRLTSLLVISGTDQNLLIRSTTVRFIEWIWRSDPEAGTQILLNLSKLVIGRRFGFPIPNRNVLDTVMSATILVFILNYRDADSVKPLRSIVKQIVNTLLPFQLDSRIGRLLTTLIFRRVLFSIGLRFLEDIPDDEPLFIPANVQEIEAYFKLPQSKKDLMLEIIKLFYKENGSLSDNIGVIETAVQINDGDINWAIIHMLARRGSDDLLETADVIEHIFNIQVNRPRPSYHASFLLGVYGHILQNANDIELAKTLFVRLGRMTEEYLSKTNCRVYYLREYIVPPISSYIKSSHRLFQKIDYDFFHILLERAIQDEDWDLLKAYSRQLGSVGFLHPSPVLKILEPFLITSDINVLKILASIVKDIHSTHPELVEEYLIDSNTSTIFKTHVNLLEDTHVISNLYQAGIESWLLDAVHSDYLTDAMVLLLGQMPHCDSDREWYAKLFGFIINLVFEKPLVNVEINSVDVGFKTLANPWRIGDSAEKN